jgi:hypothetical protein
MAGERRSFSLEVVMTNAAVQFQAANGQWVCAEGGGGGPVVANRGIPDTWETFSMIPIQGGVLEHGDLVALQVFDGQYVCAEGGGGQAVVANRIARRDWETFTLVRSAGTGALADGDYFGLKAYNGQYVCAEGGGGAELVANRNVMAGWETFRVSVLAPRRVRVELDNVVCTDTEDIFGGDEFFAVGAGADRFSGQNMACLSIPFFIGGGQTKSFAAATSERVLFEGDVDAASTIVLGIKFYDEDVNKDWTKHSALVTDISSKVADGVASLGPKGVAGGAALLLVTLAVGLIMSVDQDDLLGDSALELPVSRYPIGTTMLSIGARQDDWTGYSSWRYLINLRVTVN